STFFHTVNFRGLTGADTIRVGSPDANTPGRTDLLRVTIVADGGNNAGDTLIFDDRGSPTGRQAPLTRTTLGGGTPDTFFARLAATTFSGFDNGSVQIEFGNGAGDDSLIFDDSKSTVAADWTVNASSVSRVGAGSAVNYSGLERMTVNGGSGANTYTVN